MKNPLQDLTSVYNEFRNAFADDYPAMITFNKAITKLRNESRKSESFLRIKSKKLKPCEICVERRIKQHTEKAKEFIDEIFLIVAEEFKTTPAKMKENGRRQQNVFARRMMAYILVHELKFTTIAAGSLIGKDHSSVCAGNKEVLYMLDHDQEFLQKKVAIYEKIRPLIPEIVV